MTDVRKLARRLANALEDHGVTAEPIENDMAVRAQARAGNTVVWLPEHPHASYLWGPINQYAAPANWALDNVAMAIARTLA